MVCWVRARPRPGPRLPPLEGGGRLPCNGQRVVLPSAAKVTGECVQSNGSLGAHTCGQGCGLGDWGDASADARLRCAHMPCCVLMLRTCRRVLARNLRCARMVVVVCTNVGAEHDAECVVGAYVGSCAHEPCEWSWPGCWGARAPQQTAYRPSYGPRELFPKIFIFFS